MRTLAAIFLSAVALPTYAAFVYVEPDDFAIDADLRNAVPGVTLSVHQHPSAVVRVLDGTFLEGPTAGQNIASTGTRVFGHTLTPTGTNPTVQADFFHIWTTGEPQPILRADFAGLASFVSIDAIANDDDSFALRAYDAAGVLLDEFLSGVLVNASVTMSITRPTPDIKYVLASGLAPEGAGMLDNFRAELTRLNAPHVTTLLVFGLLGAGFARKRRIH